MGISRLGHNSGEGKELLNQRDNAERRTNGYKQTVNKFKLLIRRIRLNITRAGFQAAFGQGWAQEEQRPEV